MASAVLDDWAPVRHQASSSSSPAASSQQAQQQKKPRHRHSPEQLAALNELFDKNEHPPLEARTALAERLRMETKTVNAWFQNKRASSKKRTRTQTHDRSNGSHSNPQTMSIPAPPPPASSAATTPGAAQHPDLLDEDDHEQHHFSPLQKVSRPPEITPGSSNSSSATFFAANPDLHYFGSSRDSPDPTGMTRKMRMRPTAEQTEELKKLYNITAHPTSEERQALAERIGMRYQSITNWFQNQRSLAKRRKEDEHTDTSFNSKSDYPHHGDMRQYSAFPPRLPHQVHPSLAASSDSAARLPLPSSQQSSKSSSDPSLRARRSPSVSPSMDEQYPRRTSANMRRSTTPYGGPMQSRPRRSRPEPYQLDALKGLLSRTSTPTIEERSALALAIGMEVGKVTNWFRNLRQTARKRNSRHHGAEQDAHGMGSDEEDDDMLDQDDESPQYSSSAMSRSASRAGTPSRSSSASSLGIDERHELETRMSRHMQPYSNIPSEDDDYPEAVTPENGRSPSPGPVPERRAMHLHSHSSSKPMHTFLPPPTGRDLYPHDPNSSYPPHSFFHTPPSSFGRQHYPLPPMNIANGQPLLKSKGSLGMGRFNTAVSLVERESPSFYPPHPNLTHPKSIANSHPYPNMHSHSYMEEDPVTCAKAAERFGINLEDAYLLLDFKFHRQ